ncbi:(d)CMP kinase [Cryptosporangium sp. NPDC051539]|uniref:(d)CMP kinase n=1 Tax=Cryptosporangium sp. NPDC051539 TaxID=3363962 RepID=UPI0037951E25
MQPLSISIDGPTASGKTTLGSALAAHLGAAFLDTGLTFRALAYALAKDVVQPTDDWRSFIEHRPMSPPDPAGVTEHEAILYDGRDITGDIWDASLDADLKKVAADERWRDEILRLHRDAVADHPRIVVVGRDVALTLLPGDALWIYLTASLPIRRERRRAQYATYPARSIAVGPETPRDQATRAAIKARPGALEIDSTGLPPDAVFSRVLRGLPGNRG